MNDQIKALMGQTLDEKFAGTWSTMDMQDLQKFTERFAELIIQECILAAETDWHTPDGWGWTSGQAKAIEFIYERFGIEE
jgi:hypothetical protein